MKNSQQTIVSRVKRIPFPHLIGVILFLICLVTILATGKTYRYTVKVREKATNLAEVVIEMDLPGVLEMMNVSSEGHQVTFLLQAKQKGDTFVNITIGDEKFSDRFFVHPSGILSRGEYLGEIQSGTVVSISVLVYIGGWIVYLILRYRRKVKENLYQYENITLLSTIFFLVGLFLAQSNNVFVYQGLIQTIQGVLSAGSMFAQIAFPVALLFSLVVTFSNLSLMRKEGKTWRNMLGCILGVLLLLGTLSPILLGEYLQRYAIVIDVHNERGIWLYLERFVTNSVFSVVAYVECVFIATVILGVKAAKHVPRLNKEYLLILGCQIQKDGSLTKLLQSRVDWALAFASLQKEKTGKDLTFVPSGGKGPDEVVAEAEAIRQYLVTQGVEESRILVEDQSKNTEENILNSLKLIQEAEKAREEGSNPTASLWERVAFSTTNYHVLRAGLLSTMLGTPIEGMGAKTKSYFWINAFIREFVATLAEKRKYHLWIVGVILLVVGFMTYLTYWSVIH